MTQVLKMDKAHRDEEAKLCAFLKSSLSDEAKMTLRSTPAYVIADIDNDSFAMYKIARDSHACSTSFNRVYAKSRFCAFDLRFRTVVRGKRIFDLRS